MPPIDQRIFFFSMSLCLQTTGEWVIVGETMGDYTVKRRKSENTMLRV